MKNTTTVSEEEFIRLVEEHIKEYNKRYIPWVKCANGNTYVGFDACDYKIERAMNRIENLLNLMGLKDCSVKPSFEGDENYYYIISGEDNDRAAFIQKFFDNGYKLSWN